MTDKEYIGLSVGGTVEFRPGVQEVSHKVQPNKAFFLCSYNLFDLLFAERRDCSTVHAAGKEVKDSHAAKTRRSGVLYMPVIRFVPVHDVSTIHCRFTSVFRL